MTLTSHAIIGATITSSMPNHPIIGFALAFASHFLLDAIPHWDYKLSSQKVGNIDRMNDDMIINKDFYVDLTKIGMDMLCGILLVVLFFNLYTPHLFFLPMLGAAGAVLPDALQFAYWKYRHQPLISLQRFHIWIHAKTDFNNRPMVGISFQIIVIVLDILAYKLY